MPIDPVKIAALKRSAKDFRAQKRIRDYEAGIEASKKEKRNEYAKIARKIDELRRRLRDEQNVLRAAIRWR